MSVYKKMTTVKTPINKDFEPEPQPIPSKKGDSVSYYTNSLLPANAKELKGHRKGIPGGDWNQENDVRFANISKISAEVPSDKVYTIEDISKGQWQHEEKLVHDLIQPGGARTCPSDQILQEFAKACEFLEPTVVGSVLINTLRDSQVPANNKAKAVCGIDSLIRAHVKYRKYFHANCAALNEAAGLAGNETVVKTMLSTVIENLQSGKPGRDMLKRSQTSVISTPKKDVDLISFDENNDGDKTSKSRFSFIRAGSNNISTPLQEVTPQNGSGVLDLMSLDVSMIAPTPNNANSWNGGQLDSLPSAILSLYQQQELQQPQQKNGKAVNEIPPLHAMHAFLWDDVQSMQSHQLESSSGIKQSSSKVMDEREKAFDFINF